MLTSNVCTLLTVNCSCGTDGVARAGYGDVFFSREEIRGQHARHADINELFRLNQ